MQDKMKYSLLEACQEILIMQPPDLFQSHPADLCSSLLAPNSPPTHI